MSEKMLNRLNGFTITDNDIIVNRGLSIEAIGLYVFISSKPSDWDFSYRGLLSQLPNIKEKQLKRVVKELVIAHALVRHKTVVVRKRDGYKYAGFDWIVNPNNEDIEKALVEDPVLKLLSKNTVVTDTVVTDTVVTKNGTHQKEDDISNTKSLSNKELSKKEERENALSLDSIFPFYVEEFGEDEKSNTINSPSMNQVKAKARDLSLSEEVAESFWLKQEQLHWAKMLDWVPALRRFGMSWKRNEEKYGKTEKKPREIKKPRELQRPRTVDELKKYFSQIGEEELKKRTLKISKKGEAAMPYWTGKQFCTLDGYALDADTSEKFFKVYLKNFDAIEKRVA